MQPSEHKKEDSKAVLARCFTEKDYSMLIIWFKDANPALTCLQEGSTYVMNNLKMSSIAVPSKKVKTVMETTQDTCVVSQKFTDYSHSRRKCSTVESLGDKDSVAFSEIDIVCRLLEVHDASLVVTGTKRKPKRITIDGKANV